MKPVMGCLANTTNIAKEAVVELGGPFQWHENNKTSNLIFWLF